MLARYDAADISAPDFSYCVVSPLAAWRIYEVARYLGMGLTMHSAYELGVSVMMRMHIASFALAYDLPVILPTWGESPVPGSAYAIDGHYNQWVDDVLLGRQDGLRARIPDHSRRAGAGRGTGSRQAGALPLLGGQGGAVSGAPRKARWPGSGRSGSGFTSATAGARWREESA